MTVRGVDVGVRLGVLLRGVELRDFLGHRREEPEGERRRAQHAKDDQEGEKSELADAPPLRGAFSPEERQCRIV